MYESYYRLVRLSLLFWFRWKQQVSGKKGHRLQLALVSFEAIFLDCPGQILEHLRVMPLKINGEKAILGSSHESRNLHRNANRKGQTHMKKIKFAICRKQCKQKKKKKNFILYEASQYYRRHILDNNDTFSTGPLIIYRTCFQFAPQNIM